MKGEPGQKPGSYDNMLSDEQIESAADNAIDQFKSAIDDLRDKLIDRLKRESSHKSKYVADSDAHYLLEQELNGAYDIQSW